MGKRFADTSPKMQYGQETNILRKLKPSWRTTRALKWLKKKKEWQYQGLECFYFSGYDPKLYSHFGK
jgi:hypothetical protein